MKLLVASLLLLGACATSDDGLDAGVVPATSSLAHVSWQLSLDGQPATCAELRTETVVVVVDDSEAHSQPCSAGELAVSLSAGPHQLEVELDTDHVVELQVDDTEPVVARFTLAHLDVAWAVAPSAPFQDVVVGVGAESLDVPYATGGARLFVEPGEALLVADFFAPEETSVQQQVTVPATGTSVDIGADPISAPGVRHPDTIQ